MTDGKHTPGPWKEYRFGEGSTVAVRGADGTIVAKACWNQADAHLIAAAPELWEALRLAEPYLVKAQVDGMQTALPVSGALRVVRAALAKAEGRET